MLRLALAATMMYGAMGLTHSGSMFTLYTIEKEGSTDKALHVAECLAADGSLAIGTSATNGPDFTANTGLQIENIKPIIIGECYELDGGMLVTSSDFAAGESQTDAIVAEGSGAVISLKFATATTGITMLPYVDAFASGTAPTCAGTAGTARDAVTAANVKGWQCSAGVGAMTTGYALPANTDEGVVTGVSYVTVEKYSAHTGTAGGLCTGTADVTQGRNRQFWPVTPDAYTAGLGPANSAAVGLGLFVNLQAGFCFSNSYDAANSNAANSVTTWNLVCSGTNGAITYTQGSNLECDWATIGNEAKQVFTKNDKCVNPLVLITPTLTESWNLLNSDAEYELICPTIGVTGGTTGVKSLKVYSTTTDLARASSTTKANMTGAGVTGSRDVLMGLCYTAETGGELAGFIGGPFGAGGATTEPATDKKSYMFAQDTAVGKTTEVELLWYTTPDCSGTAGTPLDDGNDANTGWPHIGFAVFAGEADTDALVVGGAAAGTTASSLTTATKYITVKKHTDATTSGVAHGGVGICLGGGTEAVGQVLDHFVLGNCHIHTGSATAASQKSYKWECDGPLSIKYTVYKGEVCEGEVVADTALVFTKEAAGTPSAGGKCLQVGADGGNVSWEIRNDDTQWAAMCPTSSGGGDTDSSAGKIAATVAAGAAAAAALLI